MKTRVFGNNLPKDSCSILFYFKKLSEKSESFFVSILGEYLPADFPNPRVQLFPIFRIGRIGEFIQPDIAEILLVRGKGMIRIAHQTARPRRPPQQPITILEVFEAVFLPLIPPIIHRAGNKPNPYIRSVSRPFHHFLIDFFVIAAPWMLQIERDVGEVTGRFGRDRLRALDRPVFGCHSRQRKTDEKAFVGRRLRAKISRKQLQLFVRDPP